LFALTAGVTGTFQENVQVGEKITVSIAGPRTIGARIALWKSPTTGATIAKRKATRVRTAQMKRLLLKIPKSVSIAKKQVTLQGTAKRRKSRGNPNMKTTENASIVRKQVICQGIVKRKGSKEIENRIKNVSIVTRWDIFRKIVNRRGL
jgi:hypothetical protein